MKVTKDRVLEIFHSFVDMNETDTQVTLEDLRSAGATDMEIETLGFGYCLDTEAEDEDE